MEAPSRTSFGKQWARATVRFYRFRFEVPDGLRSALTYKARDDLDMGGIAKLIDGRDPSEPVAAG